MLTLDSGVSALDIAYPATASALQIGAAGENIADALVDALNGQLTAISNAMETVILADDPSQAMADIVEAFAVRMLVRRPGMAEGSLKARKAEVSNILRAAFKCDKFYEVASALIDKGEIASLQGLAKLALDALKDAGLVKGRAARTPKGSEGSAEEAPAETPYDAETALVEGLAQALKAAQAMNRGDLVESIEHLLARI